MRFLATSAPKPQVSFSTLSQEIHRIATKYVERKRLVGWNKKSAKNKIQVQFHRWTKKSWKKQSSQRVRLFQIILDK
jgi:hypothetical protein